MCLVPAMAQWRIVPKQRVAPPLLLLFLFLSLLACSESTPDVDVDVDVEVAVEVDVEVEVLLDIEYLDDANYADAKDKVDIYRPAGASGAPVLVFLHGGGLQQGDKSQQGHVGNFFAAKGYVVVCANYRLSPTVIHPAHIEDAAASFAWAIRNIERYGGDPDRVALSGHSAGAYLAALLAVDGQYLESQGLEVSSIKAVAPISGFFHVDRVAPDRPKTVWGESEAAWIDASPSKYVSASAPPTLLLYADADTPERRQESLDLAAELTASDHRHVETQQIADRDHGSIWRRIGEDGDATAEHMLRFLQQTVGD